MDDQYVTKTQMQDALAPIHTDLGDVKTRLTGVETRLTVIEARFNDMAANINARFNSLERQLGETNATVNKIFIIFVGAVLAVLLSGAIAVIKNFLF